MFNKIKFNFCFSNLAYSTIEQKSDHFDTRINPTVSTFIATFITSIHSTLQNGHWYTQPENPAHCPLNPRTQ